MDKIFQKLQSLTYHTFVQSEWYICFFEQLCLYSIILYSIIKPLLLLLHSFINCQISSLCREKVKDYTSKSTGVSLWFSNFISELGLPVVQFSLVKMCLQVPVKSPSAAWKHTCSFRDGLYTCRAFKHQEQSEREWSGTRWAGVISADCSGGKTHTVTHERTRTHTHTWRKLSAGIHIRLNSSWI